MHPGHRQRRYLRYRLRRRRYLWSHYSILRLRRWPPAPFGRLHHWLRSLRRLTARKSQTSASPSSTSLLDALRSGLPQPCISLCLVSFNKPDQHCGRLCLPVLQIQAGICKGPSFDSSHSRRCSSHLRPTSLFSLNHSGSLTHTQSHLGCLVLPDLLSHALNRQWTIGQWCHYYIPRPRPRKIRGYKFVYSNLG